VACWLDLAHAVTLIFLLAAGHGGILIAAGFEKVTPGDEASPEGYWQLKEQDEKKIAAIVAILERAKRSPGFK